MMYWHDGGGPGWGGWLLMSLFMLAFWVLVVLAAVAVYRGVRGRQDDQAPPERRDSALQMLDERFARGEIDADEYTTRRDLLRSNR